MAIVESNVETRPFVSVIVPTYNRPDYLEDALRSIIAQDYPADCFEIIVVDNGSTDDTLDRISRLAQETAGRHNLKYVREQRRGLVFCRHTGAKHANAKILLFTDDDAVFDRNWIAAIVELYRTHPDVGAVGTKIAVQWDREPPAWVRQYEHVLAKLNYGERSIVKVGLEIYGPSFSIRRDHLLKVRGFNPGQNGKYIAGDSETGLCRKLANAGVSVGWTPSATVWHRQRVEVNGKWKDIIRRYQNYGISEAYQASFYGWSTRRVLGDVRERTYNFLRQLYWSLRKRDAVALSRTVPFEWAFYVYYLKYLWLYRFGRVTRQMVKNLDWEFTETYHAPPLQLNMRRADGSVGDIDVKEIKAGNPAQQAEREAPFITLIIPTLNRCESLKNAIASALQQTWPADRYEILVVDNGCVDGTREHVEGLAKNSKTFISVIDEPRLGLHHARHAGVRAARGEILIFTDDDATFAPDWIGAYAEAFARNPEMLAAGGPVRPVWEAPPPQWLLDYMGDAKIFGILSLMEPYQEFRLDRKGFFFGVNMVIRRSVFDWTGFHPELFGSRTLGDGETGLNRDILRNGGLIGYVPDALVYHHIPPSRMTINHIRRWAWHFGGAQMYERWWCKKRSHAALAREGITIARQYWRQWIAARLVRGRRDPSAIEKQFQASLGWCKLNYIWWMLTDSQVQTLLDESDLRL